LRIASYSNYLRLRVADDGVGMEVIVAERVKEGISDCVACGNAPLASAPRYR